MAALRAKITAGRKTLGEVYGAPLYGIKTGLNEAFIIDRATRDRLVAADAKSAPLFEAFLGGDDISRWAADTRDLFLINIPKGKVSIADYPALAVWFDQHRERSEGRATQQEWFELQQAQLNYQPAFRKPKIIYPEISQGAKFALDPSGSLVNKTVFCIASADTALLALLNSRLCWFFIFGEATSLRGGKWRILLQAIYVETIPIPEMEASAKQRLTALGETGANGAAVRRDLSNAVQRRILDLAPPGRQKLTRKLEAWYELDFTAFRAEVKSAFKTEIPVKERGDWEAYLAENAAEVHRLSAKVATAEREIDAIVYGLFDLTPEEIVLLEASIAGQH